jgi:hypothetical protein
MSVESVYKKLEERGGICKLGTIVIIYATTRIREEKIARSGEEFEKINKTYNLENGSLKSNNAYRQLQ